MSRDIIYCSLSRVYVKLHFLYAIVFSLSPSTLNSCLLYIHIGQTSIFSSVISQSSYVSKFMVSNSFHLKSASPNYVFFPLFLLWEKHFLRKVSCQNSLSGISNLYIDFSLLDSALVARNLIRTPLHDITFTMSYVWLVGKIQTSSIYNICASKTLCTQASLKMQNLRWNRPWVYI